MYHKTGENVKDLMGIHKIKQGTLNKRKNVIKTWLVITVAYFVVRMLEM